MGNPFISKKKQTHICSWLSVFPPRSYWDRKRSCINAFGKISSMWKIIAGCWCFLVFFFFFSRWYYHKHGFSWTLYSLALVVKSSTLFSLHFLQYWQGEFRWHQGLLKLVIISFILMIFKFDSRVVLWEKYEASHLYGFKG